ncbi:MAG TPA: FAD/NAD(P)-binding protein [Micromonosporaceae bacterium]|nr:FAD/NAD(P)-binding protein [Micromonosporaceae bacterium]
MTRTTSIAIIGLGSRGLSVLERIVTLAKRAGPELGDFRVDVIDPRCDGAGVHDTAQPDYLLLNTTCSQVSMFPDEYTVGAEVDLPGPSLYQWATERRLRLGDDGHTVSAAGRAIRPTDFLPRRLLGEYLGWFLAQVLGRAPTWVRIALHRTAAVDVSSEPDGELSIALADGGRVAARYAFLTTGYTPNADRRTADRFLTEPYPLPDRLAEVGPGQSVAIGGFGLSAMDIMSCLTVGRGGRFAGSADRISYRPSGREPTLLFYSRSGVPCRARPLVTEFEARYEPLVLTHATIDRLRESRSGRLDFDADVLPLIHTEMRIAYRRCQARCTGGDAEQRLHRELTRRLPVEAVLDELDRRLGRFDAPATLDGATGMPLSDSAAYQSWLADVVRRDLAEGVLGFAGSPVKAALDVVRELRDTIRYVVDFGGLTEHSLDEFNRSVVPVMNRAVVGPQFERHSELLALLAAGIAAAPFGPAPTVTPVPGSTRWRISSSRLRVPHCAEVDWIAAAHVPLPAAAFSASPLLCALHGKGWIRPYRPDGTPVVGLDVNRDQHPIRADGRTEQRLWVLGPLCEGATFYNNLVPSPNTYSRPIYDAHRCVTAMVAEVLRVPADAVPTS